MAASLILQQNQGSNAGAFKYAIFICGSLSICSEGTKVFLRDESPVMVIEIPTAYIVGSADPSRPAGQVLYNICEREKVTIFEYPKGYIIL